MNKIVFPSVDLEFNVSRVLFQVGPAKIYWYGALIVFAIALSLVLMYHNKKRFGIDYENVIEIVIWMLITGVIGARLFYVLFNLDYYREHLGEIFSIQNGGLAIYGGIIAGSITAFIICKKKKIVFIDFADYVAPYLALSQAIGRLGNFYNVEAYGIKTKSFFRMGIETARGYVEVHPCFLYEMVGCFAIFIILKKIKKREFSIYLMLYGILRFFVEALRADSLMFLDFKVSQIISVIIVVIGATIYIKNKKK